jgi:hypothetical protein
MLWRFEICVEEEGKSIGHRIRKLHASENRKVLPVSPGILRIYDLGMTDASQVVNFVAKVTKIHSSKLGTNLNWVTFEDHQSLAPEVALLQDWIACR